MPTVGVVPWVKGPSLVLLGIAWLAFYAFVAAPIAAASTSVAISGATLTVIADASDNVVAVTDPGGGNYGVTDTGSGATVSVGSGCASDGSGGALCPTAGLTAISVSDPSGSNSVTVAGTIALPATLSGGSGHDALTGAAGADTIDGNGGDDSLNGQDGTDTIHGGQGNDTVDAGFNFAAGDHLFGDEGDDQLQGWAGVDDLHGGPGNDLLMGRGGGDSLFGDEGDDDLRGQDDNDPLLSGGGGDDYIRTDECGVEHPGQVDVIDGGPGSNTADLSGLACYPYPFGGVTVSLDGVANDLEAGGEVSPGVPKYPMNVLNVTTVAGLGGGADVMVGSSADETFIGGGDRPDVTGDIGDRIEAGDGDDIISDSGGDELLDGGPGEDMVDFSGAFAACALSLDDVENDGPGVPTRPSNLLGFENATGCRGNGSIVSGDAGDNILRAVADLGFTLNGMGGADQLIGTGGEDTLNGGLGNDLLEGFAGNDTLHGDEGDDVFRGGTGKDVMIGDAGTDRADYAEITAALTVTLDGLANDGQVGEEDNVQTDVVRGGSVADSLSGGAGEETLIGGPGADQLHGGEAADTLVGGPGADWLDGQGGEDLADYSSAGTSVSVTLDGAADDGAAGEGDNAQVEDVLGGDFADVLGGDGNANALLGGEGADQIDGAAGDDTLVGGPGEDGLTSGSGADALLARDGEADQLSCDVAAGKTIEADPIDTATVCDLSAVGGPDPVLIEPVAPGSLPLSLSPPGSPGRLTPAALLATLTNRPRAHALLRVPAGGVVDLGELACAGCTASAVLRKGKATIARGSVKGGSGPTALTAALTGGGRGKLRRGGAFPVVAAISVAKGKVRVELALPLRLRGGGR